MTLISILKDIVQELNDLTDTNTSSKNNIINKILEIYIKMCEVCKIDKFSIIAYNINKNNYVKTYEYNIKDKSYYSNYEAEEYINIFNKNDENTIFNIFNKVFDTNHIYIYVNKYDKIKLEDTISKLESIGYCTSNNIKELYISSINIQSYLSYYCIFEKHDKSDNDFLTSEELDFINIINNIIYQKVNSLVENIIKLNSQLIKDIILDSEEIPIVVVEKKSSKVLSVNEIFSELLPEIKEGEFNKELHDIIKSREKFIDNNINISNNYNNINSITEYKKENATLVYGNDGDNRKWLRKIIPFEIFTGKNKLDYIKREAYIIYYKNNTDYMTQISKVDYLTKAMLSNGFDEYYNTYVKKNKYKYALCSLDIDKFKFINSMFGYEVGDEVLKEVSGVIEKFISSKEAFSRLGEDKFAIFLSYKNKLELHNKLKKLFKLFDDMKEKKFSDIKITIASGITLVDKKLSLNILLDQSTTARKTAKGSHENKFVYYNLEWDIKFQKEIEIEERVPFAVENNEYAIFLQPKFDLNSKKICGAEALVRWITPKGMIFPDQFIPLFEKNGFIITLDFIVYKKVMEFIRYCLDNNLKIYPISVNVSRNHIKDKNFISKFINLIKKYNIPREYLELEVTESMFVEDREELKDFIDKIKEQDLKVSIDDFGTAYSSLQTLTDINVDILKIDKVFLDNIDSNIKDNNKNKDEVLIKNIVNLAKELDFVVLCEGVETEDQIKFLKEIGCDLGQGYVFAKPMAVNDYKEEYL